MFKVRYLALSLLLDGAMGQAGSAGPRHALLTMQVDVLSKDGGKMEVLPVGGKLPPGAGYAVKVTLGAPAHLYLVQIIGKEAHVVAPPAGQPAPPLTEEGTTAHLPSDGSWLSQRPTPGAEVLVLVATPGPTAEAGVLAAAQGAASSASGKRRDPPPQPTPENKRGNTVEVVQDAKKITVARFPFVRSGAP